MTIKEIDERLEEGKSLKAISQAFAEIANLKIKRIRSEVERNRLFFDEISKIYGIIKAFALKKKVAISKPKKRLCILITSNYRFNGKLNTSLINYFVGSTRELNDVDKIVLGRGAVDFFKASKILPEYKEILLKTDSPTPEELIFLVKIMSEYNQVLIFHSKLKSLLVQRATFTDITATSFYTQAFQVNPHDSKKANEFLNFIFEPELPRVLNFFENQILTLLLEETFLESELSRTASRFISMDQAETEANKFIKESEKIKGYAIRSMENNKILENFASIVATQKYGTS